MTKKAWESLTWGKLATLEYGKSFRNYDPQIGLYPVYGTNGQIGWCETPLYNKAGIIIGRKGAYRGVHYSAKPFFVIDTRKSLISLLERKGPTRSQSLFL